MKNKVDSSPDSLLVSNHPKMEVRRIKELTPYKRNSRLHSPEQINRVAQSIQEFGWTNPILIAQDNTIIAGHARLEAAKQLGLIEVPTIALEHLTSAQIRAYTIADNALALDASWDESLLALELGDLSVDGFDLSLTGFSDDEINRLLDIDSPGAEITEDDIPAPPVQATSRLGDLWLLGDHRLLCGDCTDAETVQRLMAGERAILFATDPPYFVNYTGMNHPQGKANKDHSSTYGMTWDDAEANPDLWERSFRTAREHAIQDDAAWYCWYASVRHMDLEAVWKAVGAFVHQQIIWVKDRGVLTYSWFSWGHEPCLMGWVRPHKPPRNPNAQHHSTIWSFPRPRSAEDLGHPTSKPVALFSIPMQQHTRPGELCYEPFSGSGTQIIAAEQTGRRCYAMEIEPQYVDVAVLRWQNLTGGDATLDGDGRTFTEIAAERGNADHQQSAENNSACMEA